MNLFSKVRNTEGYEACQHQQINSTDLVLFYLITCQTTYARAQSVRAFVLQAEGWVFESKQRQT